MSSRIGLVCSWKACKARESSLMCLINATTSTSSKAVLALPRAITTATQVTAEG